MNTSLWHSALWQISVAGALTLFASSARAQSDSIEAAFDTWNVDHGGAWRLYRDSETSLARCLWGGRAAASSTPRTDAEFFARAREVLLATEAIHGVDVATLVDDAVHFLPLASAGSTDKMSVRLRQSLDGVGVDGGWVNLLFARDGAVLSIDTQAVPQVSSFDATPSLPAAEARRLASAEFQRVTGGAPDRVGEPRTLVERSVRDGKREARLAWAVAAEKAFENAAPQAFEFHLDARSGEVLSRRSLTHDFDVSGTVSAMVSPGTLPDISSNLAAPQPVPHVEITSAAGNVTADANGNFNFVGVSPPLQITIQFTGPWSVGANSGGPTYSLTTTLNAASGNLVLMNAAPSEQTTAQSNAYLWVNRTHDWLKQLSPTNALIDFQAKTNTNLTGACNAYYSVIGGTQSINFFRAGSTGGNTCPNMAYSSVVAHELGHWLNDEFGTGNGSDGMGEGMADTYATYQLDNPVVGEDFCGTGCFVRTALNTRQFCGDGNGGCYGGVHIDGEVLMGALWKVRSRLKTTLGGSGGSQTADNLFNAWLLAFDDTQITSLIEVHWLSLDDDDGNILNGTPNYLDIDGGFRDQGFPGVNATLCPNFASYCTPSTTTLGCNPTMTFSGTPSASATSGCVLSVFSVDGQRTGLIFYGISGRVAFPWTAGSTSWYCVKSPVQRTFVQNSGGTPGTCNGNLAVDWNNFRHVYPGALGNPIQVGQKIQTQAWFRDPPAPKTTNLSDAMEFTVCP
jgi:hypothetical protein